MYAIVAVVHGQGHYERTPRVALNGLRAVLKKYRRLSTGDQRLDLVGCLPKAAALAQHLLEGVRGGAVARLTELGVGAVHDTFAAADQARARLAATGLITSSSG
jgi:hypothetical protein